ncbi:MAG: CPBP family intramembrane metalloprotease [Ignavibacteriales bacterium]|nr:CPBP family intramembrane metalloprotease [Ignavibacteriales bacterium]
MYLPIIYLIICIIINCAAFILGLGFLGQILVLIMGLNVFILQKFIHRDLLKNLGFRKCGLVSLGKGFLLLISILGFISIINIFSGFVKIQSLSEIKNPFNSGLPISSLNDLLIFLLINFSILFILEFFTEELLFRGYLLNRLSIRMGEMKGIFISSIIFGLWHLPISIWLIGFDPIRTSIYILNMFLLGSVFSSLFLESRSLIPVAIFHALWNTLEYNLYGFANQTGLLTGTNRILFDPEEGIIGTAVLLIWAVVLFSKKLELKKGITQHAT